MLTLETVTATENLRIARSELSQSRLKSSPDRDEEYLAALRDQILSIDLDELSAQVVAGYVWSEPRAGKIPKRDGSGFRPVLIHSDRDAVLCRALLQSLSSVVKLPAYFFGCVRSVGLQEATRVAGEGIAGEHRWAVALDIVNCFGSIEKGSALEALQEASTEKISPEVLRLLDTLLASTGSLRDGLPQGYSISPLLAGCALRGLGEVLARFQGVRYVLWVDDLLLLAKSRVEVLEAETACRDWLASRRLSVTSENPAPCNLEKGQLIEYLGLEWNGRGVCTIATSRVIDLLTKVRTQVAADTPVPELKMTLRSTVEYYLSIPVLDRFQFLRTLWEELDGIALRDWHHRSNLLRSLTRIDE